MIKRWLRPAWLGLLAGCLACCWGLLPRHSADAAIVAGVEVQARGPVHEAFATLTTDPVETRPVTKRPPPNINELPPAEKPEGDVIWIGGYWAWDDDRENYLWVSGAWRTPPPGKHWVPGYWREEGVSWQWVPGFWATSNARSEEQEITYLPPPPAVPDITPPPKPQGQDCFYVPGNWGWSGTGFIWQPGYWARVQPGYVWVPDHFRWTPSGHVFVEGYWDLALKRRGILYAPVVIQPTVVTASFVYTPTYAVRDNVIVEAMFVRPTTCHYYFGDYYEPRYRRLGYESTIVYSQRRYDSIIVYETYERRQTQPNWVNVQVNVYNNRVSGAEPRPPQVVNNTTVVNNYTMIAPTTTVVQQKNINVVNIDNSTRVQAQAQASAIQQVSTQRSAAEVKPAGGVQRTAQKASLSVPKTQVVKAGMVAPKMPPSQPITPVGHRVDTSSARPKESAGQPKTLPPLSQTPNVPAAARTGEQKAVPQPPMAAPKHGENKAQPPVAPKGQPPVAPKAQPPVAPKAGEMRSIPPVPGNRVGEMKSPMQPQQVAPPQQPAARPPLATPTALQKANVPQAVPVNRPGGTVQGVQGMQQMRPGMVPGGQPVPGQRPVAQPQPTRRPPPPKDKEKEKRGN